MKFFKAYLITVLYFAIGICWSACSSGSDKTPDEPPVKPSPDKISLTGECRSGLAFSQEGGTKEITFTTGGGEWSASLIGNPVDWCEISPTSGSSTNGVIKVSVTANANYDERSAVVQITCGSAKQTVRITQKQKDALLISSNNIGIEKEGGSFQVTVRSNIQYTYSIPSQFSSWIKRSSASGRSMTERTIEFSVEPNSDSENREGYIVFSGEGMEEILYVTQAGGSLLILSSTEQNVPASGGTLQIEVSSNCDFVVSDSDAEWVHTVRSRSMSSHTVCIHVDEYTGTDAPRRAEVVFTSADGSVSETLTIIQHEKGEIILGDTEIEATPGAGAMSMEIASNIDVGYKISTGAESWVRVTIDSNPRSRAMQTRTVWMEFNPNVTGETRSATITLFDYNDPDYEKIITIDQEPVYFELLTKPDEGSFKDADSHSIDLVFATNIDSVAIIASTHFIPEAYNMYYNIQTEDGVLNFGYCNLTLRPNYSVGASLTSHINIVVPSGWDVSNLPLLAEITIYQDAPVLTVSKVSEEVSSLGASIQIPFIANLDYRAEVDKDAASWVSLSDHDTVKRSYTAKISPNTSTESRTATITAYTGSADIKTTFTIIQKGVEQTYDRVEYTLTDNIRLSDLVDESTMTTAKAISISGPLKCQDYEIITIMAQKGTLKQLYLSEATMSVDAVNGYSFAFNNSPFSFLQPTEIPQGMFENMPVSTLEIMGNITVIHGSAFEYCSAGSLSFPSTLVKIDRYALTNARALRKLDFSKCSKLSEIPDFAVTDCPNLEEVQLPPSVTKIGVSAFSCANINPDVTRASFTLKLPETLRIIDKLAFYRSGLASVEIPSGVSEIGENVFDSCDNLRSAIVHCVPDDKILPAYMFRNCSALTDASLPEGFTEIGEGAFAHAGNIASLMIPSSVRTIGRYAFNQSRIRSITLPEGLVEIGEAAFSQCCYLSELTIPASVKNIGRAAFSTNWGGLTRIYMNALTPPTTGGDLFHQNFDYSACTLYVPSESLDTYRSTEPWSRFPNITGQ